MRLFIAADFNELNDYFAGLQKQLPQNAKLNSVKSFHLTLKFLGEVPQNDVGGITDSLIKIKFEKFSVSLDSIGIFPTEDNARVVWVGLKPQEKIIELQKQVDYSLEKFFRKETDFKAHITLARVKFPVDRKSFADEIKKIKIESRKIEIKDFRLMKSSLTPQGPVYGEIERFNSKHF